jgi:hypothetical protein
MKENQPLNSLDKVTDLPYFGIPSHMDYHRGFKKFWAKRGMDENGNPLDKSKKVKRIRTNFKSKE